jgi:alpha-glucosidase (family GH31 glycosyl hydrolase)
VVHGSWGGLGAHRYPVGFSGDVFPSWESLSFQAYFTATAANVAFGYWSHDIGGFMRPVEGQLYTRCGSVILLSLCVCVCVCVCGVTNTWDD